MLLLIHTGTFHAVHAEASAGPQPYSADQQASASSTAESPTAPSTIASPAMPLLPRAKSSRLSSTISALNSFHSAHDGQTKNNGVGTTNAVPHNHRPQYVIGSLPPSANVSPQHMQQHYLRAFSSIPKGNIVNNNLNNNNINGPPHPTSSEYLHHQHQQHQLPQPQSSIFTHIQSGGSNNLGSGRLSQQPTHASGGYILSVNTATGETLTSSG